jgi:hypothetical protein
MFLDDAESAQLKQWTVQRLEDMYVAPMLLTTG